MGRNVKKGLDYFPFDVDFFQDIKIRKLIKYQRGKAVTVYALLLCLIYKNGYQSLERVGIASGFALLRGFVFLVPSFLFMPRLCGTEGIWLAMPLSELLTALVILGVSLWRRQRIG